MYWKNCFFFISFMKHSSLSFIRKRGALEKAISGHVLLPLDGLQEDGYEALLSLAHKPLKCSACGEYSCYEKVWTSNVFILFRIDYTNGHQSYLWWQWLSWKNNKKKTLSNCCLSFILRVGLKTLHVIMIENCKNDFDAVQENMFPICDCSCTCFVKASISSISSNNVYAALNHINRYQSRFSSMWKNSLLSSSAMPTETNTAMTRIYFVQYQLWFT